MIGYVKGTIEAILPDGVILDNAGIGYHIFTSKRFLNEISSMHQEQMLFTHLYVREDEMSLYGFSSYDELHTFKMLIGISGVGPKSALSILSILTVQELNLAIFSGDTKSISKANGIGAKAASRIVMELKDKVSVDDALNLDGSEKNEDIKTSNDIQDTILALVSLGYTEAEAWKGIRSVSGYEQMNAEVLLKATLKNMF